MALTKSELSSIIKEEWSMEFYEELRPLLGISSLVNNDYEGQIGSWGDTVKVPTLKSPGRAQVLTSDNEAYSIRLPEFSNTELKVDKSAVYPVEITDWADYISNPNKQEQIRKLMAHEIARALDQAILDAIAPSASQGTVTAMTKAYIAQASRVLDVNNVPDDGRRVCVIDPYYKEDLVQINEILSRDFNPSSSVFLSGSLKDPIYGFKIYVSNLLPANTALCFHPSFMQIAVQKGAEYKEMDLEGAKNIPMKRVRALNLFGLKQFDADRVYKIFNT